MEGLQATKKVDKSSRKISRLHRKLTDVDRRLPAARKVDGNYFGHTKS